MGRMIATGLMISALLGSITASAEMAAQVKAEAGAAAVERIDHVKHTEGKHFGAQGALELNFRTDKNNFGKYGFNGYEARLHFSRQGNSKDGFATGGFSSTGNIFEQDSVALRLGGEAQFTPLVNRFGADVGASILASRELGISPESLAVKIDPALVIGSLKDRKTQLATSPFLGFKLGANIKFGSVFELLSTAEYGALLNGKTTKDIGLPQIASTPETVEDKPIFSMDGTGTYRMLNLAGILKLKHFYIKPEFVYEDIHYKTIETNGIAPRMKEVVFVDTQDGVRYRSVERSSSGGPTTRGQENRQSYTGTLNIGVAADL